LCQQPKGRGDLSDSPRKVLAEIGKPTTRSGFMTHAEAEKSIKLFAKEVLPRLWEVTPVTVD
jgi:hypothetical protein